MLSQNFIKLLLIILFMTVRFVQADTSTLLFTDIAAQNGVNLPNLLNESLAWGDYDNDGDEDLFVSTVDTQNKLFKNLGNSEFVDVTNESGIIDTAGFSVGAAFGDLDNDGDLDLIVINFNSDILDELYRNDGPIGPDGQYVFTEVATSAGITDGSQSNSSRGVALIDYDKDTLLDIYVTAIQGPDIFYRNLGDFQFESVAQNIGLTNSNGEGVGVVVTDVNNDNWPDMFVGNRSSNINALYLNNQDGTFTDIAEISGIDKIGLGMGVLSFDYDNDGDLDLYWTTFPGNEITPNALYENLYSDTGIISFAM